jgi:hypothetical protein
LIIVAFVFNIVTAQSQPNPTTPPNSSSSSSKTEKQVGISIDRDLKLKLNIDDDTFDMKLIYPKKLINKFAAYLLLLHLWYILNASTT